MNAARKLLLTTTAGLAILFGGCSARNTGAFADAPPPAADATVSTVLDNYATAATHRLQALSADFNQDRPAGAQPIVYIDYDQVVTWAEMQKNPQDFEKAISDYLTARSGKTFDSATIEKVFNAMNTQQPTALTPAEGVTGACLVIPEYPGASFDAYYRATFTVDEQDMLKGKVVVTGLSTQEYGDFADAHESWHCLDGRFRSDTGTGLVGAVKDNRAEMFADIGGAMESIKNGADLSLIDRIAASRATWVYLTGPARAETDANDPNHFMSIVYNTQPGLYALKDKINDMGIDNFRKLDHEEMRKIAYDLVDHNALNFTQAAGLWSYYASGKAPAAVQGEVAQLRDIAAHTVRAATPQEQAALVVAPVADDAQIATELKTRAAALGDANSLANQLKARQELTDKLRDALQKNPAGAQAAQARADKLFLSNPRLTKGG